MTTKQKLLLAGIVTLIVVVYLIASHLGAGLGLH